MAGISQAHQGQPASNPTQPVDVPGQPGDGADGSRDEEETVRTPPLVLVQEVPGKVGGDADARKVVVAERGMANVCRDQEFVVEFARQEQLAVGQMARLQGGVDTNVVVPSGICCSWRCDRQKPQVS